MVECKKDKQRRGSHIRFNPSHWWFSAKKTNIDVAVIYISILRIDGLVQKRQTATWQSYMFQSFTLMVQCKKDKHRRGSHIRFNSSHLWFSAKKDKHPRGSHIHFNPSHRWFSAKKTNSDVAVIYVSILHIDGSVQKRQTSTWQSYTFQSFTSMG